MSRVYICDVLWWQPDLLTAQHDSWPVSHVCAISGAVTVLSLLGMLLLMECSVKLTVCFSNSDSCH